jgi:carboxyl-terminal processing protease
VQTIQELASYLPGEDVNPGAVKVTIRKFYRPSGSSTQLKGVIPDIVLPSINNYLETGESSLTNALPWDTIDSAKFDRLDRVTGYLPALKEKSSLRIGRSKDWDWVKEDVERFRKLQAEKTVSLNQAERLKERDENKTRAKARKKELLARKQEEPKTWDLTVKLSERDGLPDPIVRTNVVATSRSDMALLKSDGAAGLGDDEDEVPEVETPGTVTDLGLREAERILIDYAELLANPKKETAAKESQR